MPIQSDCLFCKIAAREVPSAVVYETESVLAFKDLHPQAPVHVLVITKRHIAGAYEITSPGGGEIERLVAAANRVARDFNVHESGYRLVINCKGDAGQSIDHLHLHLLGGRKMHWPPG